MKQKEMKQLNMEKVTKRYNDLMCSVAYEHNTIGTRWAENTEGWTLRDMVAECDYILSTYYETGHANEEMKRECYKVWKSETGKLQRFIKAYEPYIKEMKCVNVHCSWYDNK